MDLPSQHGKLALVTGGNNGIGFETALALAAAGAAVVLAGRDTAKLDAAAAALRDRVDGAKVETVRLDLADLSSVEDAATALLASGRPLDLLVDNAGIMAIPERRTTRDGFELTFGTNHLGHFALTGRLLPALLRAEAARVVTVSAKVARTRGTTLDDPQSERSYDARGMAAYTKSKVANVVFSLELARRAEDTALTSVAVHPGTSYTGLQQHTSWVVRALTSRLLDRVLGQSPSEAAQPSLYAATHPAITPGAFVAPTGRAELRGAPGVVEVPRDTADPAVGRRLWTLSESLTGVSYL